MKTISSHRLRSGLVGVLVLTVLILGMTPSRAALLLLEDFDGIAAGPLGNVSGWTTVDLTRTYSIVTTPPGSASDHLLESTNTEAYSYKATPEAIAESGNTVGTLYFQVYTTGASTGLSIGLTQEGGSNFTDYRAQMAFNNGVSVISGSAGTAHAIDNISFESDTWYHLWMVVDNATNTWSAYLLGGDITEVTQLSYGTNSTFDFRATAAAPIESLFIARGTGGGANRGYINNLYFGLGDLHGELPPSAIPEPSTVMLLGAGLLLGAIRRARSMRRRLPSERD